jgi:hypothetical protein
LVGKVEAKIEIGAIKIDGKLIDVTGLIKLVADLRALVDTFATAITRLGAKVSRWLVAVTKEKLEPAAKSLFETGRGLVTRAHAWVSRATDEKPTSAASKIDSGAAPSPGPPPAGVDLDKVHDMILEGREPQRDWWPWIAQLDFTSTPLSDLAPIAQLNNLTDLYLLQTQVKDLTPITQLKNLTSLNLRGTQVTDLAPHRGLPNLEHVYVDPERVDALARTLGREGVVKVPL